MKTFVLYSRKYATRVVLSSLLYGIAFSAYPQDVSEFGDFPFENSFLSTSQPDYISVASGTNTVLFTEEGIQLTPNQQHQFGGVFFNDRKFKSVNGIIVEFEYMMYGGGTEGGDGLSMFLFDASVNNPQMGASGAGIGYTYNSGWGDTRRKGLSGAYLGVAFDTFGNFNGARFQYGSRQSGIPFKEINNGIGNIQGAVDRTYKVRDEVILRGAKNGPISDTYNGITRKLIDGYSGYPVLIAQSPAHKSGLVKADNETANYIPVSPAYSGNEFKISGNEKFTDSNDPNYRKAIVELFPAPIENGGGFYVTVSIQHGTITDVIIEDYHYKQEFYYQENIMRATENPETVLSNPAIFKLNAKVPESLRIGFAAATGQATNFHVIKNVQLRLPRAAEAYDDSTEIHYDQTALVSPFDNDAAYEGIIRRIQTGSPDNIDPATFRFLDNGNTFKLNQGETSLEYTTAQGIWRYEVSTREITFRPSAGFRGIAKIQYNIKGKKDNSPNAGPYEDEAYRSLFANVVVNVLDTPAPPVFRKIITNKMVTSKPRK